MDYLIKKSDGSVVEEFPGDATKVKLPEQAGGDVVFVGDKRPIELGAVDEVLAIKAAVGVAGVKAVAATPAPYLLIRATEIDEPLDNTKKRGPTITDVDINAQTVTIIHTTIAMTLQELWKRDISLTDKDMPRWLENHIQYDHKGIAKDPYQQSAYNNKKIIRERKPK